MIDTFRFFDVEKFKEVDVDSGLFLAFASLLVDNKSRIVYFTFYSGYKDKWIGKITKTLPKG